MKRKPRKGDVELGLVQTSREILERFLEKTKAQLEKGVLPSPQGVAVILRIYQQTKRRLDAAERDDDLEQRVRSVCDRVKTRLTDPELHDELAEMTD